VYNHGEKKTEAQTKTAETDGLLVFDEKKHYLYINDNGQPEAIDIETGETMVATVPYKDLHKYRSVLVEGRRRWVPLVDLPVAIQYSALFIDSFCVGILDGCGIRKVCADHNITYPEYCKMRKAYPDFAEAVDEARKDRAEIFFEKIEEIANETKADKDEVALGRLKVDAFKHLSETADPSRFGKKTTIQGKIGVGIIQVETGIRRPGDLGYEEKDVLGTIEAEQAKIAAAEVNTLVAVVNPNKTPKKAD